MGEIIQLPMETTLDLDPDRTLENMKGTLSGFVYAGYDKDGKYVLGSTYGDKREILWLLERFKKELFEVD